MARRKQGRVSHWFVRLHCAKQDIVNIARSMVLHNVVKTGFAVWRSLTAELLSMLVAVLPLEEAQKASKAKHTTKHGMAPSPAHAAAAAAASRAAGTESSLSKEMLRLGGLNALLSPDFRIGAYMEEPSGM